MRFAYLDPPYLGCGKSRYGYPEWDAPERHASLVSAALAEGFDGFAVSLNPPSLGALLPLFPGGYRLGAWAKPFAAWKPGVNPGYCWEAVAFYGGRKRGRDIPTLRDYVLANITLKKGLTGAKPPGFCEWVLDFLNVQEGDVVEDWFPGVRSMEALVIDRGAKYVPIEGWTR